MTTVLAPAAGLGAGLVAGVFYAFSTFVMPALASLPPAQGAAAMRAVNRTAERPGLMTALFGTALLCLGAGVRGAVAGDGWSVAGSVLYLAGTLGVTAAANVPLNRALARDGGAESWSRFLRRWTAWNHVRTAASLGAAVLLTAGSVAG